MKLEDIGFYTLSNARALNSSTTSPLWRCELILTDKCNFNCPYCRGLRDDIAGDIDFDVARNTVNVWINEGLRNVRFTGGEPTLYDGIEELVRMCRDNGVERIAISTNGSRPFKVYKRLIDCGVNDFSISLDSGCCSIGDRLTGGVKGAWSRVVENIKALSKITYVSVGMVFTPENIVTCVDDVLFADSLGVSDIRVIPSAQFNKALEALSGLPKKILAKYPILSYRIDNIKNGKHVRGLKKSDCSKCWLALDDMAVAKGMHFPCIIYLREGGDPIGVLDNDVRQVRADWIERHDPFNDPICSKNCLDVCICFNNIANKRKVNPEVLTDKALAGVNI